MSPLSLALLDLLSLVCGLAGGLLLAFAGEPSDTATVGPIPLLKFNARRFHWGVWLLFVAFLAQSPRVVIALAKVLCGG